MKDINKAVVPLKSLNRAGLSEIALGHIHTFAYMCDALSPAWNLEPSGLVCLKGRTGPFYPELQEGIIAMVDAGIVKPNANIRDHTAETDSLDVILTLDTGKILRLSSEHKLSKKTEKYLQEVAYAMSVLSDREMSQVPKEDPGYSVNAQGTGEEINATCLTQTNPAANVVRHIADNYCRGSAAEGTHIFFRHMQSRMKQPAG